MADVVTHIQFARANLLEHPAGHAVAQGGFDMRPGFDELLEKAAEAQKRRIEDRADAQPCRAPRDAATAAARCTSLAAASARSA